MWFEKWLRTAYSGLLNYVCIILEWVRESGKTIVMFCRLIYAGSTFGILLQHHRKTSTWTPLKSIWRPEFSIFLRYLFGLWFNFINYTFHVFMVIKKFPIEKKLDLKSSNFSMLQKVVSGENSALRRARSDSSNV